MWWIFFYYWLVGDAILFPDLQAIHEEFILLDPKVIYTKPIMSQNAGTPWSASGSNSDLENFLYLRKTFPVLPDPPGIPFHVQGVQIGDPAFKTFSQEQLVQCTTYPSFNPLPFTRWTGTNIHQQNVGQFASVNEKYLPPN
jgi:hypothetical protein